MIEPFITFYAIFHESRSDIEKLSVRMSVIVLISRSPSETVLFIDCQIGAFRNSSALPDPPPGFRLQAFTKGKALASVEKNHYK